MTTKVENEEENNKIRKNIFIAILIFIPTALLLIFVPELKINVVEAILLGFIFSAITLFVYIFTGPINYKNDMVWMIRYSYIYIPVFLLFITAFPFAIAEKSEVISEIMHHTSVGVLQGCREKVTSEEDIPHEIRCLSENNNDNRNSYQWVINIGGYVKDTILPRNEASPDLRTASLALMRENDSEDHAAINPKIISGGFVFPLYIAVIAIIGGAVGMTRRVPIIQRQAWRWFKDHKRWFKKREEKHSMPPDDARELLIFQMVQVFTAPFLAMMTYYIFVPNSLAISGSLAFISGFASEIVLAFLISSVDYLKKPMDSKLMPNEK